MGSILQRLAVMLAFAGVFLATTLASSVARAALVPTCEHDAVTRIPVEWMPETPSFPSAFPSAPATEECTPPTAGAAGDPAGAAPAEDQGDLRVPAMCDERGASAIAPQRIHPVSDDRIEAAASGCGEKDASVVGPGQRHAPPSGAAPALADHAVLGATSLVPPAASELAPPYPPVTGRVLPPHARPIDHPPR